MTQTVFSVATPANDTWYTALDDEAYLARAIQQHRHELDHLQPHHLPPQHLPQHHLPQHHPPQHHLPQHHLPRHHRHGVAHKPSEHVREESDWSDGFKTGCLVCLMTAICVLVAAGFVWGIDPETVAEPTTATTSPFSDDETAAITSPLTTPPTTTTTSLPTAPLDLRIDTITGNDDTKKFVVTWAVPASTEELPIEFYSLQRSSDEGDFTAVDQGYVSTTRFYFDSTVVEGVTYAYRVAAATGAGIGPFSGYETAVITSPPTTEAGPPSAPRNLALYTWDTGFAVLWIPPADGLSIHSYSLQRSINGNDFAVRQTVSGSSTYYWDGNPALVEGNNYTYRMQATNAYGTGPLSDTVTAVYDGIPTTAHETLAVAHWLLGADNPTYTDMVTGEETLMASNGVWDLNDKYASRPSGLNQPLMTMIAEPTEYTVCVCVRLPAGSNSAILVGTLGPDNGLSLLFVDGVLKVVSKTPALDVTISTDQDIDAKFRFVAVSVSTINSEVKTYVGKNFIQEAPSLATFETTTTIATGFVSSGRPIGLGDPYYIANDLSNVGVDVAELYIFDSVQTFDAITTFYSRSGARLAQRGLVLR